VRGKYEDKPTPFQKRHNERNPNKHARAIKHPHQWGRRPMYQSHAAVPSGAIFEDPSIGTLYPDCWTKGTPKYIIRRDATRWARNLSPASYEAEYWSEHTPTVESAAEREDREAWEAGEDRAKQDLSRLQSVIDALCVATELLRQEARGEKLLERVEATGATAWADDVIQDFLREERPPELSRLEDVTQWLWVWFQEAEASPLRARGAVEPGVSAGASYVRGRPVVHQ